MNYIVLAVSVLFYLLILLLYNKKPLVQQLLFYVVYIVSVTFYQGLDIALPVYFIASLSPFIAGLRKVDKITFIATIIWGIYLVVGIIFQNASRAITMFISRCWQFLFFYIVLNNRKKQESSEINYKSILTVSFLIETVLAAYLFLTKRNIYTVVRLTAGAQPITGNTAVVVLPIIILSLFAGDSNRKQTSTIILAFLLAIWVALSGTRGYELVYALILVWMIWVYIFRLSETGHFQNRFFVFAGLAILAICILMIVPQYLDRVLTLLRLNKRSIGIRTYENAAAMEFFVNAPIITKIFGAGIGGQLGQYDAFKDAIYKQFSLGMWNQSHYLYSSGSLFHNLYMNILCNMGIAGMLTIFMLVVGIWRWIDRLVRDRYLNISYKLFLFGILVMNYYRWSTDCGIAIMAIFALMLKQTAFYEGTANS